MPMKQVEITWMTNSQAAKQSRRQNRAAPLQLPTPQRVDNQYGWLQVAVEFALELADGPCAAARVLDNVPRRW